MKNSFLKKEDVADQNCARVFPSNAYQEMKIVLVTGANGFIGRVLCDRLASGNEVIGVDITDPPERELNIAWEHADLTDRNSMAVICEKYSPDVVIHCAGIAHQKIGAIDSAGYMRVNSEATENLAKTAAESNPDVCFVFLSSVSVYGEGPYIAQIKRGKTNNDGIDEDGKCRPSSDYAVSKLDAERRLIALSDEGIIRNLIILRLAPVYDREWSLNLDRRVFAPGKMAYLKFGSGLQKMSALARPNLIDFIRFIIHTPEEYDPLSQVHQLNRRNIKAERDKNSTGQGLTQINADESTIKNGCTRQNNLSNRCILRINVCDAEPYEFNTIIRVFKKSGIRPNRPVISIPLSFVWLVTRIAGVFFFKKRKWIYSCYDKLASDLVFDNGRMMETEFRPRHSLESIFDPQSKSKS